jgi:hypothetical protein
VADFILEWVADLKSESGAGFISETLADIARNQSWLGVFEQVG